MQLHPKTLVLRLAPIPLCGCTSYWWAGHESATLKHACQCCVAPHFSYLSSIDRWVENLEYAASPIRLTENNIMAYIKGFAEGAQTVWHEVKAKS